MMKKALVMVIIVLLFAPLASDAVSATNGQPGSNDDQGEKDGISQSAREDKRRDLHVDKYSKQTIISSTWQTEEMEDKLKMRFECTRGSPEFVVDYMAEEDTVKKQIGFDISFQRLLEFRDENGNGRYDENDPMVSDLELNGEDFKGITYHRPSKGYHLSTETMDSTFAIAVRGGGEYIEHGKHTINPTETKIDISLDYDFEEKGTLLALEVKFKSQHHKRLGKNTYDEEKGLADDESWLRFREGNYSGFFSWSNHAAVDGEDLPVNVTATSKSSVDDGTQIEMGNETLYLSYPQGSEITHDPKIGVIGESTLYSSQESDFPLKYYSTVLVATVAITAVVFSAGVYMRKKY